MRLEDIYCKTGDHVLILNNIIKRPLLYVPLYMHIVKLGVHVS